MATKRPKTNKESRKETKRLITNEELWKKLTEGEYKEIIEYSSKRENDLDVQIRDNYLNIYYRGGSLLRIKPRSRDFDELYFHRRASEGDELSKEKWDSYKQKKKEMRDKLENEGMEAFCRDMKVIMNEWDENLRKINVSHDEKNEQQEISMNNRGDTPYTVVDLEYAVSRNSKFCYNGKKGKKVPRFDIIAVDKSGQLYVIELKTGLGATKGSSGIEPHIDCFNHSIGRDEENEFVTEMHELLEQKKQLGLIDESIFIDVNKKPQFIFAFSDKEGEDKYNKFVDKCKGEGFEGKILYLDNSHILKDK